MDKFWLIRSGIVFFGGFMFLLFPDRVYKLSEYLLERTPLLRDKYNLERDRKYYPHWGIVFIAIAIIIFFFNWVGQFE